MLTEPMLIWVSRLDSVAPPDSRLRKEVATDLAPLLPIGCQISLSQPFGVWYFRFHEEH